VKLYSFEQEHQKAFTPPEGDKVMNEFLAILSDVVRVVTFQPMPFEPSRSTREIYRRNGFKDELTWRH
jgi:hypothetical protein